MNAKEYLNQIGIIDAKLKVIDANINRIRTDLKSMGDIEVSSSWPDGQPHGTITTRPTERKAIKLADMVSDKRDQLKKELLDYEYQQIMLRSQLWSKRIEILNTIDKVYNGEPMSRVYHRILVLRYVELRTWEEIAFDISYTVRHTWRLHGEALKKVGGYIE